MKTSTKEYKEGYAAYIAKEGVSSNPYHWDKECLNHELWDMGFEDAYYENDFERPSRHRYSEEQHTYIMETSE